MGTSKGKPRTPDLGMATVERRLRARRFSRANTHDDGGDQRLRRVQACIAAVASTRGESCADAFCALLLRCAGRLEGSS